MRSVKARTTALRSHAERGRARLFGTSGIRGLVDKSLTPEFAARIGLSFATLLDNSGTVLVGRDVRLHSQLIQNALTSGLLAGGIDAVDCGLVPTSAALFAMKKLRFSAAIMVTASHTPAETGGILFFMSDTGEMDRNGEEDLERIYRSSGWRRLPWNQLGSFSTLNILETYFEETEKLLQQVSGFRVVVDPGNGSACSTIGRILEGIGCEVITINGHPDGTFPSRSPYPQPSTLGSLSAAVRDNEADLGIGTDGDGDRALFATDSGEILWGDVTAALFAKNELKRRGGGRIVTTVNTSNLIRLLCQEYGGDLTVTRVGPPAIAEALREHQDVIFAAEESGKYIWPDVVLYGDAALAAGRLLGMMDTEHRSLESLRSELPKMYQFKCAVPCSDELKHQALEYVLTMKEDRGDVQILTLDGLKVSFEDGSCFLVRPSGTEPVLRCYAESPNHARGGELLEKARELARDAIAKAREAQRDDV